MNHNHHLKAVLFDMDGVLFNSMPYHAEAWYSTLKNHGLYFKPEETYLHEGRTAAGTINIVYQRQYGKDATPEEVRQLYAEKTEAFGRHPQPLPIEGVSELLEQIKDEGLMRMVVTGSGQNDLLERLIHYFPGMFTRDRMITAFETKIGKPNPEPYLMALEKGGLQPNEAVVIENAPLGVQSGVAAGIFTIAVNTGPLDGQVLLDAGADLLFPSMQALSRDWKKLYESSQ
ncbi:MAG: HAD-IA family hydrolase [Mediterranea sp.]|jgi:HAD superfamily hydrolase (TIGR01509 family)|nr:HAD-IA family hydrolase [Mediterranea sp.]